MTATAADNLSPRLTSSCPPTPPNTEVGMRTRTNSLSSNASQTPSEASSSPLVTARNGDTPRRLPRNMGVIRFADVLAEIAEEEPGRFYEAATDVPENTPCVSVINEPVTMRNQTTQTTIDLPRIDERLEGLPAGASPLASSVYGQSATDNQSSTSEPLLIAIRRPRNSTSSPTPLPRSDIEAKHPGVREHTDWAEQVEEEVLQSLVRLANLAVDDNQTAPDLTAEEHYQERLNRLINDPTLGFLYSSVDQNTMGATTRVEVGMSPVVAEDLARLHAQQRQLAKIAEDNEQQKHKVDKLEKQFKKKIEENDSRLKKLEDGQEEMRCDVKDIKKVLLKHFGEDGAQGPK